MSLGVLASAPIQGALLGSNFTWIRAVAFSTVSSLPMISHVSETDMAADVDVHRCDVFRDRAHVVGAAKILPACVGGVCRYEFAFDEYIAVPHCLFSDFLERANGHGSQPMQTTYCILNKIATTWPRRV